VSAYAALQSWSAPPPATNIVVPCDVDEQRAARGFAQYPNAKKYKDYRKMFEAEVTNVDAVMIATPDHMYTPVAIFAMQQGKHVYCEKH
jgi:predicted dehydrogenase